MPSDAVIHERTVMIDPKNASIAIATVLHLFGNFLVTDFTVEEKWELFVVHVILCTGEGRIGFCQGDGPAKYHK
jgi:hypothetical protein